MSLCKQNIGSLHLDLHIPVNKYWLYFIFIYFRDSSWGIRDVDDLQKLAEQNGLKLINTVCKSIA